MLVPAMSHRPLGYLLLLPILLDLVLQHLYSVTYLAFDGVSESVNVGLLQHRPTESYINKKRGFW